MPSVSNWASRGCVWVIRESVVIMPLCRTSSLLLRESTRDNVLDFLPTYAGGAGFLPHFASLFKLPIKFRGQSRHLFDQFMLPVQELAGSISPTNFRERQVVGTQQPDELWSQTARQDLSRTFI